MDPSKYLLWMTLAVLCSSFPLENQTETEYGPPLVLEDESEEPSFTKTNGSSDENWTTTPSVGEDDSEENSPKVNIKNRLHAGAIGGNNAYGNVPGFGNLYPDNGQFYPNNGQFYPNNGQFYPNNGNGFGQPVAQPGNVGNPSGSSHTNWFGVNGKPAGGTTITSPAQYPQVYGNNANGNTYFGNNGYGQTSGGNFGQVPGNGYYNTPGSGYWNSYGQWHGQGHNHGHNHGHGPGNGRPNWHWPNAHWRSKDSEN